MIFMDYLKWLYGLEFFGIKLGLDNITELLRRLGNPHKGMKFIHIAGTNGKGSVTAMIYSILKEAGYNVGMYTSPHLVKFNERIKADKKCITDEEMEAYAKRIYKDANELRCTFFEATTAIAFLYFAEKNVDFVSLEVGMGGRLDATNVVTPLASIITNIGLEHTEYLGRTIKAIAAEKAGIIKEGVPVVTAATGEALRVIREAAKRKNCRLYTVNDPCRYETSMIGDFQKINSAVAVKSIEVLNEFYRMRITGEQIRKGLMKVYWPGRMDFRGNVLFDCAHNLYGMRALKNEVKKLKYRKLILLTGMLKDKKYPEMLGEIVPLADKVIITRPGTKRAAEPEELAKYAAGKVETIEDVGKAFERAKSLAGKEDLLVVTGSIYLVGNVMEYEQSKR